MKTKEKAIFLIKCQRTWTELLFGPSILQKVELVSSKIEYLAERISKQVLKLWLGPFALLMIKRGEREIT